jgi:hypothetical protein
MLPLEVAACLYLLPLIRRQRLRRILWLRKQAVRGKEIFVAGRGQRHGRGGGTARVACGIFVAELYRNGW